MAKTHQRLPSLNALRVFDVAASCLNFRQAASRLSVTAAAVSYQIKMLETELGKTLFLRIPSGLKLTAEGQALHSICNSALALIADGLDKLRADATAGKIRIATLPGFSAEILMRHREIFIQSYPDVAFEVHHSLSLPVFSDGFDFAIFFGHGPWPDVHAELLFNSSLTPTCSPALAQKHHLKKPADLRNIPILVADSEFHEPWFEWFHANDLADWDTFHYIQCNDLHTLLSLAISGAGAIILPSLLTKELVKSHKLVRPFKSRLTHHGYYLLYPSSTLARSNCRVFRDWICDFVRQNNYGDTR